MSGHWNPACFIDCLLQSLPRRSPNTWFSFFSCEHPAIHQHITVLYTQVAGQPNRSLGEDVPTALQIAALCMRTGERIQMLMPKAQRAGAEGHSSSVRARSCRRWTLSALVSPRDHSPASRASCVPQITKHLCTPAPGLSLE